MTEDLQEKRVFLSGKISDKRDNSEEWKVIATHVIA